ncbi:hypothetical protein GF376_01065 [Candidatus Peregrinibacteria bacterium]|nr:hypothetical protein [Candidatus Peregrinibacteria bacterium]
MLIQSKNMSYRNQRKSARPLINFDRNAAMIGFVILFSGILLIRLFSLQVLAYDHYKQIATEAHFGFNELPAYRGEIYIKDYASGDLVRVATNSTLDLLYADPTMIKDKKLVANTIVPLIYDPEEAKKLDEERVQKAISRAKTAEELEDIEPLKEDELYEQFYDEILEKISSDIRPVITLSTNTDPAKLQQIKDLNLTGIEITENDVLKAYPPDIINLKSTAAQLGEVLETPPLELESILKGRNRYVVLKKKLPPETSTKIKEVMTNDEGDNFIGLGLKEEYYRYYPEKTLAANVLGFVGTDGNGNYGIESKFNTDLKGKKGVFQTQKDSVGRLITVGDSVIEPAVDGSNVTLTIDRSIQMVVENKLERTVKGTRADTGQVIVMDPKTGKIIAIAHYPSFDPNNYSEVYEKEDVKLTDKEIEELVPIEGMENTFWQYRNFAAKDRTMIFKKELADDTIIYQKYKNNIGPESYQNKVVSGPYEPGSVYKIITAAIGIDDQDVQPGTVFNDSGILKVDEFEIKNVSAKCTGRVTVADILAYSCNTGMGQIAQRVGRNLFYSYMERFGMGKRTEIEFENEHPGKLEHFNGWAESELVTHAFGQGFTATMVQMATAISTIANDGIMMQPYIVESIEKTPGKIQNTEPTVLGQIIRPETAELVKNMMVGAVEKGVSGSAKINTHYVAGKTGTSQTYRNGKPLTGAGTTIASIGGFGPIDDPQFVILVKLDHPRSSEWADSTAAPLFKEIAEYLYEYYSIPPDK